MKKNKKVLLSISLILIAILYTVIVKFVGVQSVGVNNTNIGLASLNTFISKLIGIHMSLYNLTEIVGILPLMLAGIYGLIGLVQFIKRKSLFKVDRELIILGCLYFLVIGVYVFFEHVIINYRPVIIDGVLEASYPSSHTLMAICISISSIMISKKIFGSKIKKVLDPITIILLIIIVFGRLLSGVHWFTDIIGGCLISGALLATFGAALEKFTSKKSNTKLHNYI